VLRFDRVPVLGRISRISRATWQGPDIADRVAMLQRRVDVLEQALEQLPSLALAVDGLQRSRKAATSVRANLDLSVPHALRELRRDAAELRAQITELSERLERTESLMAAPGVEGDHAVTA
jgi:DNA repair exonuclease SbcCD ATPase subunit